MREPRSWTPINGSNVRPYSTAIASAQAMEPTQMRAGATSAGVRRRASTRDSTPESHRTLRAASAGGRSLQAPAPAPRQPEAEVIPSFQPPTPAGPSEPLSPDLEPGARVTIGDQEFDVVSAIGEGTFGVVWGARSTTGNSVAIKEIYCRSYGAVSDAVYEGQILYALQGACGNMDGTVGRVPLFDACSTECTAASEWRVRLAMTQIPGESLNRYLDRRRCERQRSERRRQESGRGPSPQVSEGQAPARQFAEGCRYARELVAQLAPAFARISALAYHRDVNPRNILVDDHPPENDGRPRYGLIDFGLAVDATRWRVGAAQTPQGEPIIGAWQVLGVGGDCRFWPVSAWLMLEQGPRALSARPQLCLEYKTHLDLHALGVTALQVLAELSPDRPGGLPAAQPSAASGASGGSHRSRRASEGSPAEAGGKPGKGEEPLGFALGRLWALKAAWEAYWEEATRLWRRLFDAYRRCGDGDDLATVKAEYRQTRVHEGVGEHLRNVRFALRDACQACEALAATGVPGYGLESAAPLLHALFAMVSSGEDSARSSWRRVELLIERGDAQAAAVNAAQAAAAAATAAANAAAATATGDTARTRRELPPQRERGEPRKSAPAAQPVASSAAPSAPTTATTSPGSGASSSPSAPASLSPSSPSPMANAAAGRVNGSPRVVAQ